MLGVGRCLGLVVVGSVMTSFRGQNLNLLRKSKLTSSLISLSPIHPLASCSDAVKKYIVIMSMHHCPSRWTGQQIRGRAWRGQRQTATPPFYTDLY